MTNTTKVQFYDFYAPWCGPCNKMKPIVEEFIEKHKDEIDVHKIDCDTSKYTAQDFGVRSIPTFVFVKQGEELSRRAGPASLVELESMLNATKSI